MDKSGNSKKRDQSPIALDIERDKQNQGAMQRVESRRRSGQIANQRPFRQRSQTSPNIARLHPMAGHEYCKKSQQVDEPKDSQGYSERFMVVGHESVTPHQ